MVAVHMTCKLHLYLHVDAGSRLSRMSIGSSFQPKNGLPVPKGPSSASLPSLAIVLGNKEVVDVVITNTGFQLPASNDGVLLRLALAVVHIQYIVPQISCKLNLVHLILCFAMSHETFCTKN